MGDMTDHIENSELAKEAAAEDLLADTMGIEQYEAALLANDENKYGDYMTEMPVSQSSPTMKLSPPREEQMTEAPASWNGKFIYNGQIQQYTLRDTDEFQLVQRVIAFIDYCASEGIYLLESMGQAVTPAGHPAVPPATPGATPPAPPSVGGVTPQTDSWCQVHSVEMPQRLGKDGNTFYSHQMENGNWCNPGYRKKALGN